MAEDDSDALCFYDLSFGTVIARWYIWLNSKGARYRCSADGSTLPSRAAACRWPDTCLLHLCLATPLLLASAIARAPALRSVEGVTHRPPAYGTTTRRVTVRTDNNERTDTRYRTCTSLR